MDCDCVVLVSEKFNSNFYYLTGYTGESISILIIYKKKKPVIFATKLDECNICNDDLIVKTFDANIKTSLKKIVDENQITGFDYSSLTLKQHKFLEKILKPKKQTDISGTLLSSRSKKDEIEHLMMF
jgi:Xaa-Pro aminopeptidase